MDQVDPEACSLIEPFAESWHRPVADLVKKRKIRVNHVGGQQDCGTRMLQADISDRPCFPAIPQSNIREGPRFFHGERLIGKRARSPPTGEPSRKKVAQFMTNRRQRSGDDLPMTFMNIGTPFGSATNLDWLPQNSHERYQMKSTASTDAMDIPHTPAVPSDCPQMNDMPQACPRSLSISKVRYPPSCPMPADWNTTFLSHNFDFDAYDLGARSSKSQVLRHDNILSAISADKINKAPSGMRAGEQRNEDVARARGQSPCRSTCSSIIDAHGELSRPTVPTVEAFTCQNEDCCEDEDCNLPCDTECQEGDCGSCDGSQTCFEPCDEAEACSRLECDNPSCLEGPQSLCMNTSSRLYASNSMMTPPASEISYVDPRQVLLNCHWETSGQQCEASMPSRNALSQHIRQDHLQWEAMRPCHWDACNNQIDVDDLPDHVWSQHSPAPKSDLYVCLWQGCHLNFSTPDELDQHMKAVHCQMNCHWDGCDEATVGETALLAHVDDEHLGVAPTSCTTSPTIEEVSTPSTPDFPAITQVGELNKARKHKSKGVKSNQQNSPTEGCDGEKTCQWSVSGKACGFVSKNGIDLQSHVENVHLEHLRRSKDQQNICLWIGCPSITSFSERGKLRRHMYTHTKYMVGNCQFCGKEYNNAVQLANHERTHTKERPFPCEKCDFKAANKAALTTHMRIHTGEKPLKCDKCDYTCGDSSNMSKHRKTHEAPIYHCNVCGKSFCRANTLKRHMQTHG